MRKLRVISRNSLIEVPREGLSNSTSSRRGAPSDPALELRLSSMPHLMVTSLPCQSPLYTCAGPQGSSRSVPACLSGKDPARPRRAYLLARDGGEAGPPLHLVQVAQVLADGA